VPATFTDITKSRHIGLDEMTEMRADLLSQPGSAPYRAATTPHNATVVQRPVMVAHPGRAAQTGGRSTGQRARRGCADRIRSGAGGHFRIEHGTHRRAGTRRPRRCGCDMVGGQRGGRTRWAAWTGRVLAHGGRRRLHVRGRSRVLTRPHGMASSALLAVDYIDGNGQIRRAEEDAPNAVDREALWAFRGGGGVRLATALTVELVAPQELWAGYLLWSIDALGPVVDAWVSAMGQIGDALSTSISVLHTPPGAPTFTRSSASVTLASGCSGLRPACVPCRIDSAQAPCWSCCCAIPLIGSPQSRCADRLRRPIGSVLRCKKRKSSPTTTFRTSRHRSSSNTSPTCNCSGFGTIPLMWISSWADMPARRK
jgi:hypothetical protein